LFSRSQATNSCLRLRVGLESVMSLDDYDPLALLDQTVNDPNE